MTMPDHFKIRLNDKPKLKELMESNPEKAKELINTFTSLIEESLSVEESGVAWIDLPKKFHKDLNFKDIIHGILHGALDCKEINPENWDALKEDVHPFSLFSAKEITRAGGVKVSYNKWREHFQMEGKPDQESISQIIRNMMRYARYVNFKLIFENMKSDWQVNAIYRGLGAEHVKRLPFYPAIRYQEQIWGELGGVGRFFNDIGSFDCGLLGVDEVLCPACKVDTVQKVGKYAVCPSCNAGYVRNEE